MNTAIRVEAQVHKKIEVVWECYTSPNHIVNWNFASYDWCCPSASNDLKVGGLYSARMEAKDGSFGFDFNVRYTEVQPIELLAYIMEDGRKARITFSVTEYGTHIVIVFDPENVNSEDLQREGWQAILNNFKKYVEDLNE